MTLGFLVYLILVSNQRVANERKTIASFTQKTYFLYIHFAMIAKFFQYFPVIDWAGDFFPKKKIGA